MKLARQTVKIFKKQFEKPLKIKKNPKFEKKVVKIFNLIFFLIFRLHLPTTTLFILILTITITQTIPSAQAHPVSHIRGDIWNHLWKEFGVNLTTYFVHRKTLITNLNTEISSKFNTQVSGLTMTDSKTIHFLPIKVVDVFPNLVIYEAFNCAIKLLTRANFENLSKLKVIDVQHNQITSVTEDAFDDLSMLVHLDLANNKIHEIAENSFKNLHMLRNLYLGFNEIEELPLNIFRPLRALSKLALPSNRIRAIRKGHFMKNKKLTNIWLNENELVCMDEDVFDEMNRLRWVYLEGNSCIDKDYREKDMRIIGGDIRANCGKCE